jgi:hypothetical protein
MRKQLFGFAGAMIVLIAAGAFAQETAGTATGAYYEVRSALGAEDAQAIARDLDQRFQTYNRLFRFDPSALTGKLKVRAFANEADFDAYLKEALGETRDGACYLHYSKPERSELTFVRSAGNLESRAFAHQAFVQFIRAFVPNPPAWIREGFAIFYETLNYDRSQGNLVYEENLAWLETIKKWGQTAPALDAVILGNGTADAAKFQPAAWALVSFILNSDNEDYRRDLYESLLLLDPSATTDGNTAKVAARLAAWTDPAQALSDLTAYIGGRKTFGELLDEGRAAYTNKEAVKAELAFMQAAELRPSHYAPYYYLGLLAYERKDYSLAENHYRTSLQLGADEALVSYALGVNAMADDRPAEAKAFLDRAKTVAPTRYGAKADELIARLR